MTLPTVVLDDRDDNNNNDKTEKDNYKYTIGQIITTANCNTLMESSTLAQQVSMSLETI